MKATIKRYQGNIVVFYGDLFFSLHSDDFFDIDCNRMKVSQAREYLTERVYMYYNINDDEFIEQLIDELYSLEYIISDREVYMYKIRTYETYMASEKGTRWMTHCPVDTEYYKHEMQEQTTKYLPDGFEYYEDEDQFIKNGIIYDLVNENDGSVSLVSSEGIVKWF